MTLYITVLAESEKNEKSDRILQKLFRRGEEVVTLSSAQDAIDLCQVCDSLGRTVFAVYDGPDVPEWAKHSTSPIEVECLEDLSERELITR